jgi:rare lipoprotein A
MTQLAPYRSRGLATWYGRRYHGKQTSSGEPYDMYAMTAAHPILPIPSYAKVTNLANGRSVVVRINDRGPFVGDRLIDLSYVAAYKLDLLRNGSAPVEVESIVISADGTWQTAQPPPPTEQPRFPVPDDQAPPLIAGPSGVYLQLAAFSLKENAERFAEQIRAQLDGGSAAIRVVPTGTLYRIHAGPYPDRGAADQAAQQIAAVLGAVPIIAPSR